MRIRVDAARFCLLIAVAFALSVGPQAVAITWQEVEAKVSEALAGHPRDLEAAILAIFDGVSADDAGPVADKILLAAKDAPTAARTAVGRALARHVVALSDAGHSQAARSVVGAIESAASRGDQAALAAYQATASPSLTVPSGPVGSGINTQTVSPAE